MFVIVGTSHYSPERFTLTRQNFVTPLGKATTDQMDVAAIKGFVPDDQSFYARFRTIPVRPSVFGVVILPGQSHLSNDVAHDALHVGTPRGRVGRGQPRRYG